MSSSLPRDAPLVIVGAGIFGLGLAYELVANRGYTNITVLDRHMPPVPDGSSVDVSRIIRSEYADPLYAGLAVDALDEWRNNQDWSPHYYEDGFLMVSRGNTPYIQKYRAMREQQATKQPMNVYEPHESEKKVKALYSGVQAKLDGFSVIHNNLGGWANAQDAVRGLAQRCSLAGVSFITGAHGTVTSLVKSGKKVTGVETAAGTRLSAETVILATGAWTTRLVPDMNFSLLAVGQPVGFVPLTPEEYEQYKDMPVIINYETGVFCFPPTPDTHELKLARHGFGYATQVNVDGSRLSSPRLKGNNTASGYLPDDAEQALRDGVKFFFPQIADRPWSRLRMCWYTDTPNGDFVVDNHPSLEGLFMATGGSGQ